MFRTRSYWTSLLLLPLVVLALSAPARAKEDTPAEAKPETPGAKPMAIPADNAAIKGHKKLIQGAREYFNLDVDAWEGRKAFIEALTAHGKDGQYPLKSPAFLNWLVAQSRSFEPMMDDRKWAKKQGVTIVKRKSAGFEVKTNDNWTHIRPPNSYPSKSNKLDAIPRPGPWPVVFAMHDKRDPEDNRKGPGGLWLGRNWDKKGHAELYENWFLVMPVVTAAAYAQDGKIRVKKVHAVLRNFWNHYHMDFDRVIVDGSDDALLLASTNGNTFLGGVILRDLSVQSGTIVDTKLRASIKNIAHMPVYVINKPKVAEALTAAGMTKVTNGDEKDGMIKWMRDVRRVSPTQFNWTIYSSDQQLAYWVNIDQPNWDSERREVQVEVKDNTIKIKAIGVIELTLFLNDDIVNLDKPVKVVINDTPISDALVEVKAKYKPIARDPKVMFETKPTDVRRFRYYGWLQSGILVRIPVPELDPKKVDEAAVTPEEQASPREEAKAAKYMEKATAEIAAGDFGKARGLLEKVLALPFNKQTEAARKLIAEIKDK